MAIDRKVIENRLAHLLSLAKNPTRSNQLTLIDEYHRNLMSAAERFEESVSGLVPSLSPETKAIIREVFEEFLASL